LANGRSPKRSKRVPPAARLFKNHFAVGDSLRERLESVAKPLADWWLDRVPNPNINGL
jgi:hypothetical protein